MLQQSDQHLAIGEPRVGVAKSPDDVLLVKNVTRNTQPNIHRHPSVFNDTQLEANAPEAEVKVK